MSDKRVCYRTNKYLIVPDGHLKLHILNINSDNCYLYAQLKSEPVSKHI